MKKMRLKGEYLRDENYNGIYVDRTINAKEWNTAHGLTITDTAQDENGAEYNIWTGKNPERICATPKRPS